MDSDMIRGGNGPSLVCLLSIGDTLKTFARDEVVTLFRLSDYLRMNIQTRKS